MEYLVDMVKFVEQEFGDMAKHGKFRNRDDIEIAYKLMDIAKDAFCIMDYESNMPDDYSEYGRSYGYNNYPYEGKSYARGMNARRNGLGQFSREGSYNSYSRGRSMGYSRNDAKEEFIENLYKMSEMAPDEQTRDRVQRMIHEMEQ